MYNYLNHNSYVTINNNCVYDSNIGYEADFSVNGEVDSWDYFDGIYTYGCWNGFLFGTLYGSQAVIGRHSNINPIDGEVYFLVELSMLVGLIDRNNDQVIPKQAKIMWTTLNDSDWSDDKSMTFSIQADSDWHTYILDMSGQMKWVGYISNLRFYLINSNGRDGDQVFVKTIRVKSNSVYACPKLECNYYSQYSHPCPGIGRRPYIESEVFTANFLTVVEDVNDYLLLNINGYGYELIKLDIIGEVKPFLLAKRITQAIGAFSIGGYAEAEVEFTDASTFKINCGTYGTDSSISILYSKLAEDLGFFDNNGNLLYSYYPGINPASCYESVSSFKITYSQLYGLLDNDTQSYFEFNPSIYNIEGGRRDWHLGGAGIFSKRISPNNQNPSVVVHRKYQTIDGHGKTLIDYSHPFNASGYIKKIYVYGTCDYGYENVWYGGQLSSLAYDAGRLYTTGVKIQIFRPLVDGSLKVIHTIDVENRKDPKTTLYSEHQENVEVDCDVWVNKGDLIGVYNISLYAGKSTAPGIIDAQYYELDRFYDEGENFYPGNLNGDGNSGLLIYARSNIMQKRLYLDIDLQHRINVKDVSIKGSVGEESLEYNILRCLDVNVKVDLFGGTHFTGYRDALAFGLWRSYECPNVYYGLDKLTDGIYIVNNGQAAEDFYVSADPTVGVVPINPYYFYVNGDKEWFKVHYFPEWWKEQAKVSEFQRDPIAFTVIFPHNKDKTIYKSIVYFKEAYNFRSFALSTYNGSYYLEGNADDPHYTLIPEYIAVTLDNIRYTKDMSEYPNVKLYLFENPSIGHAINVETGGPGVEFPGDAVIPGGWTYTKYGYIKNAEQLDQANTLDWQILQHEWEPISCKGFRFYCMCHYSTKILEMELYSYLEGGCANLSSAVSLSSSFYGDDWILGTVKPVTSEHVKFEIDDARRYFSLEITPINMIYLSDIVFSTSDEDVVFGDKGCEDYLYLGDNTLYETNDSQAVTLINNYRDGSSLYVDIARNSDFYKSILYYSTLADSESVYSPEIGPVGHFYKKSSFLIENQNRNVAINCDCYGLANMVIGKNAMYSYDDFNTWFQFNGGEPLTSDYINFSNLNNISYSVITVPDLHRSRYWRIGTECADNSINVREIKAFIGDKQVMFTPYHDLDADPNYTPASREAPHLNNNSLTGSYYNITNDRFITLDFGEKVCVDKFIVYHDSLSDYTNDDSSNRFCGIDRYTKLYIVDDRDKDIIYDYSYSEHDIYRTDYGVSLDASNYYQTVECLYDFSNSRETYYETYMIDSVSNISYFNRILPSGTIASGTGLYEYQGHLDFKLENSGREHILAFNLKDKNIFYHTPFGINPSFEFKLKVKFDKITEGGISVGFVGSRHTYHTGGIGMSCCLCSNAVRWYGHDYSGTEFHSYNRTVRLYAGIMYYVKFYNIGTDNNYRIKIWTDAFDGSEVIYSGYRSFDAFWHAERIGIMSGYLPYGDYCSGTIYSFEFNGQLYQKGAIEEWGSSIKFDGKETSYLLVPYSTDFDLATAPFSMDFFVKSDERICSAKDIGPYGFYMDTWNYALKDHSKFDDWAGYFDGSDSFIKIYNTGDFDFSDEIFTIDTLVEFSSFPNLKSTLFYKRDSYCLYYDNQEKKIKFEGYQGGVVSGSVSSEAPWLPDVHTQYHLAFSRTSSDMRFFIDGQLIGTPTTASGGLDCPFNMNRGEDHNIYIGATVTDSFASNSFVGYLEEFRVTKGFSRWTDNFTPSATPYSPDLYTFMLVRFQKPYRTIISNYKNSEVAEENAWELRLRSYRDRMTFEFVYNNGLSIVWPFYDAYDNGDYAYYNEAYANIRKNIWYHVYLCRGYMNVSEQYNDRMGLNLNGQCSPYPPRVAIPDLYSGGNNLVIGKSFKGSIKNFRLSKNDTGSKGDYRGIRLKTNWSDHKYTYHVPENGYGRLYAITLYISDNNAYYGHLSNIDLYFNSKYSYFDYGNVFSDSYNGCFAIDLGKRYYIDYIRSYGEGSYHEFNEGTNVFYSNIDSSNIEDIFKPYEDVNDTFTGNDNEKPYNWDLTYTDNANIYLYDNKLRFKALGNLNTHEYAIAKARYYLKGNFDYEFDFDIFLDSIFPWSFSLTFDNIGYADQRLVFYRGYIDGNPIYKITILDNWYTDTTTVYSAITFDVDGKVRITKEGKIFKFYTKPVNYGNWTEIKELGVTTEYWGFTSLTFKLTNDSPGYPSVGLDLDNIILNAGEAYFSTKTDARWIIVNLINGDSINRTINKMGVYTNIQQLLSPGGGYNNVWDDLGKTITSFGTNNNLAYKADVTGSSATPTMPFESLVDGAKGFGDDVAWGSAYGDNNPYVIIDLGAVYNVYRVKVFHGLYDTDPTFMVKDYTVAYSVDGVVYTTLISVSGNSSFERIHDALSYFVARYIKLTITDYDSKLVSLYNPVTDAYYNFRGAVLREVEVYEYSGFAILNSEEYPIVAINLGRSFYLNTDHEAVGVKAEDTTTDWDVDLDSFCYSDNIFNNPSMVKFGDWGLSPDYERWVVLKKDTATGYNSGPDYIKQLLIKSVNKELPIRQPWWWRSVNSILSSTYEYDFNFTYPALKIYYSASTEIDEVSFIEGDTFGSDSDCSPRDGFYFELYISDINNLDLDYGYFYFGGVDSTPLANPVIYKWYISTIKDFLVTGINYMFCKFECADEIIYSNSEDNYNIGADNRDPSKIVFSTIGVNYRGTGLGDLSMIIDGFFIARNAFYDFTVGKSTGLYLSKSEYMSIPLANFRMSSGSIAFYIRPDFDYNNEDIYYNQKVRNIFNIVNNNNDVFGLMFTDEGFVFATGNLNVDLTTHIISVGDLGFEQDAIFHVGITYSNTGEYIDSSKSTIQLYIDNQLYAKINTPWEYGDSKYFRFTIGGKTYLALTHGEDVITYSSVDAVLSHLKIYNYCKTDFRDAMEMDYVDPRSSLYDSSELIEVSKDNVTFYKVGSYELPFVFENTDYLDEFTIYIRSDLSNKVVNLLDKRTAGLAIQWDVPI